MRPDAYTLYMGSKRCVQVRACCTEGLGGPAEGFQCCGMRGDAAVWVQMHRESFSSGRFGSQS